MVKKSSKNQTGFTLIELLIVVAIIGILAAIAIPNLLNAMQRAKQKRTMADIRTMAQAWESYAIDNNNYAASGLVLSYASVSGKLSPEYIKKLPENDGWGNAFFFAASDNGGEYAIASWGKDGVSEGSRQWGPTADFNCDIIFVTGMFVEYPEGAQGAPTTEPEPEEDPGEEIPEL